MSIMFIFYNKYFLIFKIIILMCKIKIILFFISIFLSSIIIAYTYSIYISKIK